MHYMRLRRLGVTGPSEPIGRWASPETRFWNGVRMQGPCHIWCGTVDVTGYGKIGVGGSRIAVHRFAWQLAYGELPTGRLRHLCRNRSCVRVDHLRLIGQSL